MNASKKFFKKVKPTAPLSAAEKVFRVGDFSRTISLVTSEVNFFKYSYRWGFLALILSHIRSFSTVQSIRISRSYKKRHIVDQYKKKRKNVTYANLLKFEMRLVLPVPMKAIFFTLECKHSGEACLHH